MYRLQIYSKQTSAQICSKDNLFQIVYFEKKASMYQCLNKVAVLLCTACNFMELDWDLSEEALKILMYLQENLLSGKFYLRCRSRMYRAILLKTDSTTDYFRHGTCKIALFEILQFYLRKIFTIPFIWIIKWKMTHLRKYIDDLYCNKDPVYI